MRVPRQPIAQRLKLTDYRSAADVAAVFASHLADIARVDEISIDSMDISSTDPNWPKDQQDYDWLCSTIKEMLAYEGIFNVQLTPLPPRSD